MEPDIEESVKNIHYELNEALRSWNDSETLGKGIADVIAYYNNVQELCSINDSILLVARQLERVADYLYDIKKGR